MAAAGRGRPQGGAYILAARFDHRGDGTLPRADDPVPRYARLRARPRAGNRSVAMMFCSRFMHRKSPYGSKGFFMCVSLADRVETAFARHFSITPHAQRRVS